MDLTNALYECYSALLDQPPSDTRAARSTYLEQGNPTLVDPTPRIDKIISLTQSLVETLNGMINHCPYTRATDSSAADRHDALMLRPTFAHLQLAFQVR